MHLKSLICRFLAPRSSLEPEVVLAMSEDTRVHPCSSLLNDRGSLLVQRLGVKTPPPQPEHLNEQCNELIQMYLHEGVQRAMIFNAQIIQVCNT